MRHASGRRRMDLHGGEYCGGVRACGALHRGVRACGHIAGTVRILRIRHVELFQKKQRVRRKKALVHTSAFLLCPGRDGGPSPADESERIRKPGVSRENASRA